ncbi:MAG: tetraacyldisaccharide 4'-kinase [Marinifilaceae bacterium]|nr:tetraacyldisaccharide 4'-kinase [Marinifilaceae bacterium]
MFNFVASGDSMAIWSRILLRPVASLYGFVTALRNTLFDIGFLKSESFDVPVICVGNATVGGTGKTPHTEYIVSVLMKRYRVAILSRGYKRKTKGFVLATPSSVVADIGDEPMQMFRKFPNVTVACCEKRVVGIRKLLSMPLPPEVIVLDDAYQHRYVKAGMNILLCDYNRPIYRDKMLPLGRLRESCKSAVHRATHIVVTKCPKTLAPIDKRVVSSYLDMYPYQKLYYSRISYGLPLSLNGEPVADSFVGWLTSIYEAGASLLVVSGIATPRPLVKQIHEVFHDRVKVLSFADHRMYGKADLERISSELSKLPVGVRYILTTEKDAVKFSEMKLPEWGEQLYYVPIVPQFIDDEKEPLSEALLSYVEKNRRER